jgi:hypothetical protein
VVSGISAQVGKNNARTAVFLVVAFAAASRTESLIPGCTLHYAIAYRTLNRCIAPRRLWNAQRSIKWSLQHDNPRCARV